MGKLKSPRLLWISIFTYICSLYPMILSAIRLPLTPCPRLTYVSTHPVIFDRTQAQGDIDIKTGCTKICRYLTSAPPRGVPTVIECNKNKRQRMHSRRHKSQESENFRVQSSHGHKKW